jgi:2-polyprenyl-6-methoxyphenol hydroxylase-like FAD-dependent oxidoreductase
MSRFLSPSNGRRHEVVVVGGGVAGVATALLLARRDVPTLLLERGAGGADAISVPALWRGAVLQLARWDLLDAVAAAAPAVTRTIYRYGDEELVVNLKRSHGTDALYAPGRSVLGRILTDAAVSAGAQVHHRAVVTGVLRRHGRVMGVQVTAADGHTVDVGARLVVGADGIRSLVARRSGAAVARQGRHASAMAFAQWPGLAVEGYEWTLRADASSGVVPTGDRDACVFVSGRPDRIGRGGAGVIRQIVTQSDPALAARLGAMPSPLRSRTWTGRRGFVRRAHGPGWALVGDAGLYTDPIVHHGLTDALRDAELLARAVAAGGASDHSLTAALAEYEERRDHVSGPLFDIADRMAAHDWDDSEIGRLLVGLNSALAHEVDAVAALDAEAAP